MVVGIHRTGSTFVSQVLADCLPCAPLGNFSTLFPRSRFIVYKIARLFYKKGKYKERTYKSYYGISRGLFSIGDSYAVWDKWMGKDHYNAPENISSINKEKMVRHFYWMERAFGAPIIAKNNRNSLIMAELQRAMPNIFFVIVKRNTADVIQSTIQASVDFFGSDEYIWGLRPDRHFNPDNYNDKLEAYCMQCIELEKVIQNQMHSLNNNSYMEVPYKDFCLNPTMYLNELSKRISDKFGVDLQVEDSSGSHHRPSKRQVNQKLNEQIIQKLTLLKKPGVE